MRALSIRQPYAELIMRGEKTIEYRSRPTRLIGERFYIYAARKWANAPTNGDLTFTPTLSLPPGRERESIPTGVIVGTAEISHCERAPENGHPPHYCWHLRNVKRFKIPRKPRRRPQPVWFKPF
jgi:hypothetical protein